VYCNPLYQSLQTLEELLKARIKVKEENIETNNLLKEINRKEFEGKPRELYYAQKEKITRQMIIDVDVAKARMMLKKAREFLHLIMKRNDKTILIITHGHFLKHLCLFWAFSLVLVILKVVLCL